jgi:hypothetical protein
MYDVHIIICPINLLYFLLSINSIKKYRNNYYFNHP